MWKIVLRIVAWAFRRWSLPGKWQHDSLIYCCFSILVHKSQQLAGFRIFLVSSASHCWFCPALLQAFLQCSDSLIHWLTWLELTWMDENQSALRKFAHFFVQFCCVNISTWMKWSCRVFLIEVFIRQVVLKVAIMESNYDNPDIRT